MRAPPAPVQFYFDFISPYAYFASLRIDGIAAQHGRTVTWHPMLLGVSVMKVMGLKPLMDTPLKGPYVARDVARYARRHGVALGRDPAVPPMNPLTAGRAFAWTAQHHPESAKPLARALLHAYWVDGADLSVPEALRNLAPAPLDGDALVQAVQGPDAARALRDAVDASLAAGVFGSPTVRVDDEPFWGVDKLDEVAHWLTTGGW